MRVTILPSDGTVSVDGEAFSGIDMSSLDPTLHAVQWYDTAGEIEWKEPHPYKLLIVRNEPIYSLDAFQFALDAWQVAKDQMVATQQAVSQGQ